MAVYPSAPMLFSENVVADRISKVRICTMLKEINSMRIRLEHYQKIEKRYLITIKSLRGVEYAVGLSLEATAIGLQFTLVGIPISILIGATGLGIPILVEGIIKLINIKRQKYLKKVMFL